jgi:hypothetical protein
VIMCGTLIRTCTALLSVRSGIRRIPSVAPGSLCLISQATLPKLLASLPLLIADRLEWLVGEARVRTQMQAGPALHTMLPVVVEVKEGQAAMKEGGEWRVEGIQMGTVVG